jgi:protein-tyrosine phosphatase
VSTIFSLLTPEEESSLQLEGEATVAQAHNLKLISFPVEDRRVPTSPSELSKSLELVEADLQSGKNVVVHCRQGVGRSGLVGACLLINSGMSPQSAIDTITHNRGVQIPETSEQRDWIDYYAASLAGAR